MVLDDLSLPIVLAPLAGGPSTPALAAAVSGAGGLGFLGGGYLPAPELAERMTATRHLTSAAFGVNLFVPQPAAGESGSVRAYAERLRDWAGAKAQAGGPGGADASLERLELGEPRHDDDGWEEKLELVLGDPPAVISFTFGCPEPEVLSAVRRAGAEAWVTVTSLEEATAAEAAGAGVLVVQGAEAGGHRGSFQDRRDQVPVALLPLLSMVGRAVRVPLVATGGIATGEAIAGVLCAGARAAQLGTAFLLCPEAGTSAPHRQAIAGGGGTAGGGETVLTRAFTGRLARGIRNAFIDAHEDHAPLAYPEVHHLTAPLRRAARERGEADLVNLWAGEAHALARELPAGELVAELAAEARESLARARGLLGDPGARHPG